MKSFMADLFRAIFGGRVGSMGDGFAWDMGAKQSEATNVPRTTISTREKVHKKLR